MLYEQTKNFVKFGLLSYSIDSSENGMASLVQLLLEKGADPNAQTTKLANSQTPMHKAILNSHENILNLFIDFKGRTMLSHI